MVGELPDSARRNPGLRWVAEVGFVRVVAPTTTFHRDLEHRVRAQVDATLAVAREVLRSEVESGQVIASDDRAAGSVLVNGARGGLLDCDAPAKTLTDGRLFAAAVDVYDEEPLPAGHPLRAAPNVVMTSHLAVAARAARMVGAEAARWPAGEPPLHCANPEVLS